MVYLKYIPVTFIFLFSNPVFSQWTVCTGTVTGIGPFPTISVPNCSTIVVAGGILGTPRVFRSTNSGASFQNISSNLSGPELFCVWAKSQDTIFVGDGGSSGGGGGNAKVWKTVNGGANWVVAVATGGTGGFINGIRFTRPDQKFGIIMSDPPGGLGGPYFVYKTNNGGLNWITQMAPGVVPTSYGSVGTAFITDSLFYGFGLASQSKIVMTTNGGASWGTQSFSLGANDIYAVDCGPNKTCLTASSNSLPNIIRFNASGQMSAINIGPGLTGFPYFCWVYGTESIYLAGTTGALGCVKKSSNTGSNWSQMTTSAIQGIIGVDLYYTDSTVCAYALAQDGTFLKLNDLVIGIKNISGTVPAEYGLDQNYPNPFNPVTHFEFRIAKQGPVMLSVYNALGEEVRTLVDKELSPSTYRADFDGTNFASGIYYYILKANDFTQTRKMVLVK